MEGGRAAVHPEPEGDRPRGITRKLVSAVGRVVEQVSRLYGYGILISGIDAVFLAGISALPLTKWDDAGVPRADVVVATAVLQGWATLSGTLSVTFHVASADPYPDPAKPHFSERYAWSGMFIGSVSSAAIGSCAVLAPAAFGVNPRFFLLTAAWNLVAIPCGLVLGDSLQWSQYRSDRGREADRRDITERGPRASLAEMSEALLADPLNPLTQQQEDATPTSNSSCWGAVLKASNGILLMTLLVGYPLAILPYYRAESTTEYVILIVAPPPFAKLIVAPPPSSTVGIDLASSACSTPSRKSSS